MKKTFLALLIASLMLSGCSILASGLSNMDPTALATAANTAMTALTISDEQIAQLSAQSVAYMDSVNKIDKGAYDARLRKLMSKVKTVDGVPINLKVYRTNEVNAFACGDGSIRVYSGLMDVMDDSELMAVIGHEIGHVLHKDTKNAMKKTYMAYAARIALGSTGSVLGSLSTSVLGDIAQSCGFCGASHLGVFFKAAFAQTPSAYRKAATSASSRSTCAAGCKPEPTGSGR